MKSGKCGKCNQPTPTNEMIAYRGFCENCATEGMSRLYPYSKSLGCFRLTLAQRQRAKLGSIGVEGLVES